MSARRSAYLAAVAVLAAGVFTAASPAGATSPAESVVADVSSGPFNVQIVAHRAANVPPTAATGLFAAHGSILGLTFFSVAGPVTCLDVRGNRMGLFYPITASNPPLFAQVHSGVFVTIVLNAKGKPIYLGFLPTAMATAKSCAPGLALFPVTSGTATFTP